ncbi:MAG: ABC transporter transmembrane domain-containing protein [Candidatus Latescibacteria bacterium]|nr:ABC transporter transmembrane domain-containing protein [Candidatus Latescibacterota bacterium]
MTLNPFKPFSSYLKPYRKKIALGLTLLVGSQLASTAIPIFLKWAVDMAQTGYEATQVGDTIAMETALNDVIYYAVYIVLLAILSMLLQMGMRWALNSMARYVEYDMRVAYFDHLLRLPPSFYNQMPTGDLMARATNDIQAIRMFLAFGVRMILTAALAFPLSLVVMATIDWKLAAYAILPMPFLALVMNRVAAKINVGFRDIQEQFSTISARIQENLAGIRVVKAFVRREQEIGVFKHLNEDYLQKNKVLINVQSLFYPFMFLISGASLLIVLWIGGGEIIRDEMTLGEFVAFNAYLTRLVFPMITLGWMIDRYQRGVASMKRINAVLETKPEITNIPEAKNDVDIKGHIEFRHLHFDYDKTPYLNDINLVIPAGSTLAVVGLVGAGKTTLANLIPRMIEPSK